MVWEWHSELEEFQPIGFRAVLHSTPRDRWVGAIIGQAIETLAVDPGDAGGVRPSRQRGVPDDEGRGHDGQ